MSSRLETRPTELFGTLNLVTETSWPGNVQSLTRIETFSISLFTASGSSMPVIVRIAYFLLTAKYLFRFTLTWLGLRLLRASFIAFITVSSDLRGVLHSTTKEFLKIVLSLLSAALTGISMLFKKEG